MQEDAQLLRCYVETRSEDAFAELVRRHLAAVYSVALRHTAGDAHLAADVAQVVFSALARKAAGLVHRPVIGGWLHRATHYAAIDLVRAESRRRAREAKADFMDDRTNDSAEHDWEKLRPLLDEAMARLSDADRDAIWLRFFEGRSFADVGARLHLTENTARMRVERALAKMHTSLAGRGLRSTTTVLATVLSTPALVAAPASLAGSITSSATAAALAGGGAAMVTTIFMSTHKIGIAATLAVVASGGFVVLERSNARLRAEMETRFALEGSPPAMLALQHENERLIQAQRAVELMRPEEAEWAQLRSELERLEARRQAHRQAHAAAIPDGSGSSANPPATRPTENTDRPPVLQVQTPPAFPEALRQAGIHGEVRVAFIVDSRGLVRDAFALQSPHPDLDAVAVDGVSQWTFDAGVKAGRPINTFMEVPLVFDATTGKVVVGATAFRLPETAEWF